MPTFLVTPKMSPALAARVERSVTGKATSSMMRRLIVVARFGVVLGTALAIYGLVVSRRASQQKEDSSRTALLASAEQLASSLSIEEKELPSRVEPWFGALTAAQWPGDEVTPELRRTGAIAMALAQSTLYLRGTMDGFSSSERISETAKSSPKDALVLCLMDPPSARTEKALVEKVRIAYSGGPDLEERTRSVRPFHDAIAALPYFLPEWTASIHEATDYAQLEKLRTQLSNAPVERTQEAAKASQLLIAIDEPGPETGHTELDGERPHQVRVALVDLRAAKLLFRLRRPVDPSWLSETRRVSYARGLDSCVLAYDIHRELAHQ